MLLLIPLAVAGVDQGTKHLVLAHMTLHESWAIIPGLFSITSVRNPGAAFGIFSDYGPAFRSIFLVGVSVLAVGLLTVFYLRSRPHDRAARLGAALVIGGAIGNLIDRVRLGEVVDFLDVYVGRFHWPAFNVADSAIAVGIGLFLWNTWQDRHHAADGHTGDVPGSGQGEKAS